MKAITWLAAFGVAASALTSSALAAPHEGWTANYEQALADAKAQNKAVLLEFTGSDWCPPCKMVRAAVFSKKEFVEAASKNFILVELDFPKGDPELKKKNQPYSEQYKIQGYPTVVLLDSNGKEFSRIVGAKYQTVEDMLNYMNKSLTNKDLD